MLREFLCGRKQRPAATGRTPPGHHCHWSV